MPDQVAATTGAGGNSNVGAAAAQIEGLLIESGTQDDAPEKETKPDAHVAEQADDEPGEPGTREAPDAPAKPQAAEPEGKIELDEDAPLFDIKLKGEDGSDIQKKVSLSELKKGHMMEADYRRKTTDLARQREAVAAEIQKGVAAKQAEYEQQLNLTRELMLAAAAPELKEVNWLALASEDPARYVALKAKADALAQSIGHIQEQQTRIATQRQTEAEAAKAKAIAQSVEELTRDIPGWGNDLYQAVLKDSVSQYGFKPEEVGQIVDARVIKMMRDATEFRRLQASKPEVAKKLVGVPKVMKPGTTASKTDNESTPNQDAMKALRKPGRLSEDAARLFERFV